MRVLAHAAHHHQAFAAPVRGHDRRNPARSICRELAAGHVLAPSNVTRPAGAAPDRSRPARPRTCPSPPDRRARRSRPRARSKLTSLTARSAVESCVDLEHRAARVEGDLRKDLLDHPAGHQPHQLLLGGVGRHRGDITAVAQHRDAIADAPDLVHAMGDVDDADAIAPDLLDQAKQLVGLALG